MSSKILSMNTKNTSVGVLQFKNEFSLAPVGRLYSDRDVRMLNFLFHTGLNAWSSSAESEFTSLGVLAVELTFFF